jgi:hypothetical protein
VGHGAIAAGAGWFAYGQVREARLTRERVTAPDVVAYIDHNPKNWQWFDLVVKNFGQTPAYNVRAMLPPLPIPSYLDPDTGKTIAHLYIPDAIAVLAPGQEMANAVEFTYHDGPIRAAVAFRRHC